MQLISALILGTASAVVTEQAIPQEAIVGISARQLFPAFGSALHFEEKRAVTCEEAGRVACHQGCMPIGAQCCSNSWCERGTRCYGDNGCCPLGVATCRSGSIAACKSMGKTLCHDKCIPIGATCCSTGGYCEAGAECDGCIADSDSRSGGGGGPTTSTAAAQASYTLTPDDGNANTQTGGAGGGSSPTAAVTTTRAPAAAGTVAVPMLLGAAAVMANLPLVM